MIVEKQMPYIMFFLNTLYYVLFVFYMIFGKVFFDTNANYLITNNEISMFSDFMHMWEPLIIGSLILGTLASIFSYLLIRLYWIYYVKKIWSKRKSH